MKKISALIIFLLVTVVCAYTQSLTLSDSSGAVANNSAVFRTGHPEAEVDCFFFVHNTTTHSIDVLVKKVELGLVTGSINTFCWGLCFPPNVYVSPTSKTIAAGATDSSDFSGHYDPQGFSGISRIRYVFFNVADTTDSVCVNVSYSAFEVGIQNLSLHNGLSNAYPNPANSTVNFEYSVTSGTTANLIIRNVLGLVVKDAVLKNSSGRLQVEISDIPDGVYFYSLNVDGKTVVTRKLVVRH